MEQAPLDFYFTATMKKDSILKEQEGETSHLRFVNIKEIPCDSFAMFSTRIFLKKHIL